MLRSPAPLIGALTHVLVAKAVFLAPHTFAFAGGVAVVAAVTFAFEFGRLGNQEGGALAIMAIAVLLCALMEAALFSVGCAWGGVERLPVSVRVFIAGICVAAGFVVLQALMGTVPAPADLESHKRRGMLAMWGTAYIFLAPIVAGLVCAWTWKRTR